MSKRVNVCEKSKTKEYLLLARLAITWFLITNSLSLSGDSNNVLKDFWGVFKWCQWKCFEDNLWDCLSRDSFCCLLPEHTDRETLWISQIFPFKRAQSLCTVLLALLNVEGWYRKEERTLLLKPSSDFWVKDPSLSLQEKVPSYINLSRHWLSVHRGRIVLCKTRNPSGSVHDLLTPRSSGKQNNSSWTGPARMI